MSESGKKSEMLPVVIVGGGPAGLAAGITLARLGHKPMIVARPAERTRRKIGESLAPAAWPVVERLGVTGIFDEPRHLPSPGTVSSWGDHRLASQDFLHHPNGCGWHLDRILFEADLSEFAAETGCTIVLKSIRRIEWTNDHWTISDTTGEGVIKACFLIDATGRSSFVARASGAERIEHDRLVAWHAFLSTDTHPSTDARAMIEAHRDGWWYSALLPNGAMVVAFMTDLVCLADTARTTQEWERRLGRSEHTRKRLRNSGYRISDEPRFAPADSAILDTIAGPGWVACGDAAACYDPLSSHGIATALASGMDAAEAFVASVRGDHAAMERYVDRVHRSFMYFLERRTEVYAQETRWADAPFWAARRGST